MVVSNERRCDEKRGERSEELKGRWSGFSGVMFQVGC